MRILIIGGSDAVISEGLRAKEVATKVDVIVFLKDAYLNFIVCGLSFYMVNAL